MRQIVCDLCGKPIPNHISIAKFNYKSATGGTLGGWDKRIWERTEIECHESCLDKLFTAVKESEELK